MFRLSRTFSIHVPSNSLPVAAQELPPVTMTAQGFYDFGFGGAGGGLGGNGWNGAMPFSGCPYLIAGVMRLDQA